MPRHIVEIYYVYSTTWASLSYGMLPHKVHEQIVVVPLLEPKGYAFYFVCEE